MFGAGRVLEQKAAALPLDQLPEREQDGPCGAWVSCLEHREGSEVLLLRKSGELMSLEEGDRRSGGLIGLIVLLAADQWLHGAQERKEIRQRYWSWFGSREPSPAHRKDIARRRGKRAEHVAFLHISGKREKGVRRSVAQDLRDVVGRCQGRGLDQGLAESAL